MTNREEIKSIIVKSLEAAEDYDFAVTYDNIVSCGDCPYWHDCRNYHECGDYILEKLEEDEEIKVGDEIYSLDETYHSVVTSVYDSNGERKAVAISQNGKWVVDRLDNLHKTGRTFPEIAEVLKKMQEDKE